MKKLNKLMTLLLAASLVCMTGAASFADAGTETGPVDDHTGSPTDVECVEHTWNVTPVTPATCQKEGTKVLVCTVCGKEESETIPIDPDGHVWTETAVTEPTCTEEGEKTFSCTEEGCDAVRNDTISALGHDMDAGTITAPATEEAAGIITYTCQRTDCTYTKTETFAYGTIARIDGRQFKSLKEVFDFAMSAKAPEKVVVDLLADCSAEELEYTGITGDITFRGSHRITLKDSGFTLDAVGSLTFDGCTVDFSGTRADDSYDIALRSGAAFNVVNGAEFLAHDSNEGYIYTYGGAKITVSGQSVFSLKDAAYTAMMNEGELSDVNVTDGSRFEIDRIAENGMTLYDVKVDGSTFTVNNCTNQGLVKTSLELSNGAEVAINGNTYGMNLIKHNSVIVNESASLTMRDNKVNAFYMQPGSQLEVRSGGRLVVQKNGSGSSAHESWNSAILVLKGTEDKVVWKSRITIEDGADADISNNYCRGISNFGIASLGRGTRIVNNRAICKIQNDAAQVNGGGIYNVGELTIGSGALVYNNHAENIGDDIYSRKDASLTLNDAAGFDAELDDCADKITGWYYDGCKDGNQTERWNVVSDDQSECISGRGAYFERCDAEGITGETALKAAHGRLYEVFYDLAGGVHNGSETVNAEKHPASADVNVIDDPVRDGYVFAGWTIAADNDEAEDPELTDGTFVMPAANVRLTAVWEKTTPPVNLTPVPLPDDEFLEEPEQPVLPDQTLPDDEHLEIPEQPVVDKTLPGDEHLEIAQKAKAQPDEPKDPDLPETGDQTQVMLYLGIALFAAGTLTAVVKKRRTDEK